ncbi:ApeP family dehydratase [Solimonas variicoloris]|uniref:ApeP family dehydratase n=1 Tax=Solimonas variicoloris TaxID=254408 RepID=UPI00037E301B|nr:hypothetical protein [Solimonas variicoloris]
MTMLALGHAYTIAELLPHGPGFTLLDSLLDYGHEHASCSIDIGPQTPFFEAGRGVPNWVGIEYMAQAIGVYAGIVRRQAGQHIEIGLLLGTRRYRCEQAWFTPGSRLVVRADQLVRDAASGVAAFRCQLHDGERELAQAEIKAFQPDNVRAYLQSLAEGAL